jgi:hypothetical protein
MTIKAILGLTDVDCKKDIHHQPARKQGRAQLLPRGVYPPGDDQRRVRRGGTKHECYMTYTTERAEKEASETLQAGIAVQPPGRLSRRTVGTGIVLAFQNLYPLPRWSTRLDMYLT